MVTKKILSYFFMISSVLNVSAYASGFQVSELTAAQMGTVNAGVAADNDITSSFYNAATLAMLKQSQVSAGTAIIFSRTRFSGEVNATSFIEPQSTVQQGTESVYQAKGDTTSILPNFFIAVPINNQLTFGLSATSPFNWSNNYNRTTSLEWFTKKNRLNAQVLSPSLAIKVNPQLVFAGGIDAERIYANFTYFNSQEYINTEDVFNNESHSHIDGSGYGWHAGVLFEPTSKTRIGLGYRSQVVSHLSGSSKFTGVDAITAVSIDTITQDGTKMDLTLPPVTNLSVTQEVNERWRVLGTLSYTQWSKTSGLTLQNALSVKYNPIFGGTPTMVPAVSNNTLLPSLRDSLSFSIGSQVKINEQCLVRAGFGYDQSAIRNSRDRSPYLPDADTYNLGLGAHYQFTKPFSMDLAWKHIFINKAGSDQFETSDPLQTSSIVDGTSTNSADVLGLQITWAFA